MFPHGQKLRYPSIRECFSRHPNEAYHYAPVLSAARMGAAANARLYMRKPPNLKK